MAMVGARGGGRVGDVRGRSKVKDPRTGMWVERGTSDRRRSHEAGSGRAESRTEDVQP